MEIAACFEGILDLAAASHCSLLDLGESLAVGTVCLLSTLSFLRRLDLDLPVAGAGGLTGLTVETAADGLGSLDSDAAGIVSSEGDAGLVGGGLGDGDPGDGDLGDGDPAPPLNLKTPLFLDLGTVQL